MGRLLLPPEDECPEEPLVFLAGPIQGAADWQSEAIRLLHERDPDILVASPRRAGGIKGSFTPEMYREQVDWEHVRLRQALCGGVTLFWLAKEEQHYCDRAYAQTTRFELGEACGLSLLFPSKIVVGIEEGFSNARYIRHTLKEKYASVVLADSLEETCQEAVDLYRNEE